ncbi:MFS transporter [Litorilinea aerophila]|uniref:MFS transporter n=1 Tax=Litorilinea aerophila TaxID=1204385 RepID=A0A540VEE5_9CHLR|nr:MFS transporter [Litorilinea aerophila]MCC9077091.1 MFS transporter [Litorilinea aerophila]GIV76165.1 MAG: MFS transporter [Litorilinea sp.]
MDVKRLTAISLGHFAIDILNSSIAMILTAVAGIFDLSVSQIGLGAMIYTFAASLTQPLFGMVADRLRGRYLGAIGLLWTMTFYALAPLMPSYPALVLCLTIGALGSGAFHPVGIVNAAASGGRYPTTATSIFFVLGQTGLAVGPILAGIVLQTLGVAGLPYLALIMAPVVLLMAVNLRQPIAEERTPPAPARPPSTPATSRVASGRAASNTLIVTAFILLIALRSTTLQSYVTLLPKYFDDLGYAPALYGTMVGVFSFAGAMGTFLGGYLGDRFNRRQVIFLSMVASVPFSYGLLHLEGWGFFIMAAVAGAALNIPHSILLIMAQRLLPARKGMIGGAVLGFMFASGAATAWLASWFADLVGLGTVLNWLALVPMGAGLCALVLPSTRAAPAPARPATPAAAD